MSFYAKLFKQIVTFPFVYFRFKCIELDRWHWESPIFLRPYKIAAALLIRNLNPEVHIDIGCGLGELLDLSNSKRKIGFDRDKIVLDISKKIRSGEVEFIHSYFEDLADKQLRELKQKTRVLSILNCAHNIETTAFWSTLSSISCNWEISHILIDIINPNFDCYKYQHSLANLLEYGTIQIYPTLSKVRLLALVTIKS